LSGSSGGLGSSLIPKLSSLGSLDALYYNNPPIVDHTSKVSGIKLDLLNNTAIKEYVDSLRINNDSNLIFIHAATLNKDDLIVNLDSADLLDIFKGREANDVMWLCPVTEYVFEGSYPETIYIKLINKQ
jgi:hypothetical protein